ncbi:MAG: PEP-CTERM sorting domain-containing protein [Myxococcota bacterium]|nr:PEP-CTERM sorting domain-containing protein [Myxococcota bacterium]
MFGRIGLAIALLLFLAAGTAHAVTVNIGAGQTSVELDSDALELAGLEITGISDDVIAPGNLGDDSVAFPINSRDEDPPALSTTFSYDSDDFLGTFSGTIEHTGSVFFNDAIEVGNFTIGFDASRIDITEDASGFFVQDNVSSLGILFDLEITDAAPGTETLDVAAELLVSPEFAGLLIDLELTDLDLAGADAGEAGVEALAVPEPTSTTLLAIALGGAVALGRRRD